MIEKQGGMFSAFKKWNKFKTAYLSIISGEA